jgi:hypothetical protein
MSTFPEFEVGDTFLKRVIWHRYRAELTLVCYAERFLQQGKAPGLGRLWKQLRGRKFWIAIR